MDQMFRRNLKLGFHGLYILMRDIGRFLNKRARKIRF